MSLYKPDSEIARPAVGKKLHWELFKKEIDSELVTLFKSEIDDHISKMEIILSNDSKKYPNPINSSILGKTVLLKLKKSNPKVFSEFNPRQVGSLFGMTLWNSLALREDDWEFSRVSEENPGDPGMLYWPRISKK